MPDLFLQEICRSFWSPEASGEGTGPQARPLFLQRIYSQGRLRHRPAAMHFPVLIIEFQYIRN